MPWIGIHPKSGGFSFQAQLGLDFTFQCERTARALFKP